MEKHSIRVLIVDDSLLMRKMLSEILSSDPQLEVVEMAKDPYDAREKIKRTNPDVITLDVEMPRMHGIDFLEKIMTLRPMPVVMISSLTQEGADVTLRSLELGAVDFISKPTSCHLNFEEQREEIIAKVKMAAKARIRPLLADATRSQRLTATYRSNGMVVAIGASTGGVEALGQLLCALPIGCPPVLVTQHMPERFIPSFAKRLDNNCVARIAVAQDGQPIEAGHIYFAPGEVHLQLSKSSNGYFCRLRHGERISGHCPSVDALFQSVAEHAGSGAVGVILTGMGRDGASGLLAMRQAGAKTIGQDESTSLVYGMPRIAFEYGAVEEQLPLNRIGERVLNICAQKTD